MNNPYKYVDRNGNWSLWGAVKNVVKKVVNTVAKTVTKVAKTVVKAVVAPFSPSTAKNINKTIDRVSKSVTSFVNGIGGNSSNKSGGSKESKPPIKKVKVEAKCPKKEISETTGDILNIIDICIDWPRLVMEVIQLYTNGFKVPKFIDTLVKCAKEGTIAGTKISVEGVRKTVKKITGLSTGPKTKIRTIVSKIFSKLFPFSKVNFMSTISKLAKFNLIQVTVDAFLGILTFSGFIAGILADLLYTFVKGAATTAIKAFLTPFVGPFAWLLGNLLSMAIDFFDFVFGLKNTLKDLIDWILRQAASFIVTFMKGLSEKI